MKSATKLFFYVFLLFALSGCWGVDHKTAKDDEIEKDWLPNFDRTPALEFFSKGGEFSIDESIDQEHLVPLLTSIEKKYDLTFYILTGKEDEMSFSLIAKIPEEKEKRNAIRKEINEASDKFDGLITHLWGNRWIDIHVWGPEELEAMKEAGALEPIQEEMAMEE